MEKLTERDKRLLTFLGIFIVSVVFITFVFLPMFSYYGTLKDNYDSQLQIKNEMDHNIAQLASAKEVYHKGKKQVETSERFFYQQMENKDIEKEVTELALKNRIDIRELNISIMPDDTKVEAYCLSDLGKQEAFNENNTTEATVSSDSSSQDGTADSSQEKNYRNIISIAKVSLTGTGTEQDVKNFLSTICDDYTGIMVTSFQCDYATGGMQPVLTDQSEEIVGTTNFSNHGVTLNANLNVYMVKKMQELVKEE